jgi:hypothetical protein
VNLYVSYFYIGAVGIIRKGYDSLPRTDEIVNMRGVNDDDGIVYGTHVHIFGGIGSLDGMILLLKEIERQRSKGDVLVASHISADPNYLSVLRDKSGPLRIISACLCILPIGALAYAARVLIEYLKVNEGKILKMMKTNFFGSISIFVTSSFCVLIFLIDPFGFLNIIVYNISRPLYSLIGTLYGMGSLFTIFQWMDVVEIVKANEQLKIRSVSFMKSCGIRVTLLLVSTCLVASDLFLSTASLYGYIPGVIHQITSVVFALYALLLAVFEIWVRDSNVCLLYVRPPN